MFDQAVQVADNELAAIRAEAVVEHIHRIAKRMHCSDVIADLAAEEARKVLATNSAVRAINAGVRFAAVHAPSRSSPSSQSQPLPGPA